MSDPVRTDILDGEGNVVGFAWIGTPPPRIRLTRYEFRSRFTTPEKTAMYDSTDTIIKIFLDDIQAAEFIALGDQATIDGVNYLEAQGLIAAGRAAEILASIPQ